MSEREWFVDKADECARLAKEAADPRLRSTLEYERALWLQIAQKVGGKAARARVAQPKESE